MLYIQSDFDILTSLTNYLSSDWSMFRLRGLGRTRGATHIKAGTHYGDSYGVDAPSLRRAVLAARDVYVQEM